MCQNGVAQSAAALRATRWVARHQADKSRQLARHCYAAQPIKPDRAHMVYLATTVKHVTFTMVGRRRAMVGAVSKYDKAKTGGGSAHIKPIC